MRVHVMVSRLRRRKVNPKAAAEWADATRDQDKLRELYAPLADDDRALAEERADDLARSLGEIDRGAPQS
jgi:hypothetical protein